MEIQLDEGYMFGLGGFETLGIENGRLLFLKEHLERLEKCLDFLSIRLRVEEEEVLGYLSTIQAEHREHGVLKIMVSGENKIFTTRPNPYNAWQYEKAFSLEYSKIIRNETSLFTFHKTTNYGDCILEKRNANEAGFDDRIFFNSRGELCECTSSNIFLIKDERIYTPQVFCGLLPGILRNWVCDSFPVVETVIKREELGEFDGCFVTNSLMGIMPVGKIDKLGFENSKMIHEISRTYERACQ